MKEGSDLFNTSEAHSIFNFSLNQAKTILEEHVVQGRFFGRSVEITFVSCYTLLITAGICLNLLISYVIISNKAVCASQNMLVVNLNISDLALCLFCMPFTLVELIFRDWPLGDVLCRIIPFSQASTIFVSAGTISVIAIDRHQAIINLIPIRRQFRKRRFIGYTFAIWMVSVLLSLPICFTKRVEDVGFLSYVIYKKCIEVWPSNSSKLVYLIVTFVAQLVIPTTVLVVTHFRVKAHLSTVNPRKSGHENDQHSERTQREVRRNLRANKVLQNVCLVFTISWLPWNLINLLADVYPNVMTPKDLYMTFAICHIIAMTSATSNPILYGWLNTNIRRELVRLVQRFSCSSIANNVNRQNVSQHSNNVLE
ncbi:neuropeptide F receptor-like [Limulus polyphemus]|uniref:Neuropeptide F receptor-like n=1 Tax=Limulus polyphemus TaxID=6850 RepID=A0ABM1TCJ8_LIMPO|nr:neuropeptide F receptor-like [Limulus polyphemus]